MALAHGAKIDHARGTPPASVASKYTNPGKGAPESKDNDKGGDWTEGHHKSHSEGKSHKDSSKHKKKHKHKLKKAFEEFYAGKGAGVIVLNNEGKVLVGKGHDDKWQTPGGHVESEEEFDAAARRELREEAGIIAGPMTEINHF